MFTEDELRDYAVEHSVSIYKLLYEFDEDKSLVLSEMSDFNKFIAANNISTVFYIYLYATKEGLEINDEIIRGMNDKHKNNEKVLAEFEKYNKKLEKLDFKRPVELVIYCVYNGLVVSVKQEDDWLYEMGYRIPEIAALDIITDKLEDIVEDEIGRVENNKKMIADLRKFMLNDEEFHKCTNVGLRRSYMGRLCDKNPRLRELFRYDSGTGYQMSYPFHEEVWKEYKSSIK